MVEPGLAGDAECVPKLLARKARRWRAEPAYREKELGIWQSSTWDEVSAEVEALALGMMAFGVRPGDHLAIVGRNRPYLYWAIVAAQACGAVPVPLYQGGVAETFVLEHCGARFAVCGDQERSGERCQARYRSLLSNTIWGDDGHR